MQPGGSGSFDGTKTVWELTAELCRVLHREVGGVGCIVSRVIGDVLVQVAEFADDGRTFQLGRGFLVSQFPATSEVLTTGRAQVASLGGAADAAEETVLRDLGVDEVLMLALRGDAAPWGLVELYRSGPPRFSSAEVERSQALVLEAEGALRALPRARG